METQLDTSCVRKIGDLLFRLDKNLPVYNYYENPSSILQWSGRVTFPVDLINDVHFKLSELVMFSRSMSTAAHMSERILAHVPTSLPLLM